MEGGSGCFFTFVVLLSTFLLKSKAPISLYGKLGCVSYYHVLIQGKVVVKGRRGGRLLVYRKSEHPWDAFQNPNRVQNINIPRNLLLPYIICLLKTRLKKIFLMCDYSDREWVPTALWMAFYLIPLVKTVN